MFPFDDLFMRSEPVEIGTATARIASIEDLIALKVRSVRPRDLVNIETLREIESRRGQT